MLMRLTISKFINGGQDPEQEPDQQGEIYRQEFFSEAFRVGRKGGVFSDVLANKRKTITSNRVSDLLGDHILKFLKPMSNFHSNDVIQKQVLQPLWEQEVVGKMYIFLQNELLQPEFLNVQVPHDGWILGRHARRKDARKKRKIASERGAGAVRQEQMDTVGRESELQHGGIATWRDLECGFSAKRLVLDERMFVTYQRITARNIAYAKTHAQYFLDRTVGALPEPGILGPKHEKNFAPNSEHKKDAGSLGEKLAAQIAKLLSNFRMAARCRYTRWSALGRTARLHSAFIEKNREDLESRTTKSEEELVGEKVLPDAREAGREQQNDPYRYISNRQYLKAERDFYLGQVDLSYLMHQCVNRLRMQVREENVRLQELKVKEEFPEIALPINNSSRTQQPHREHRGGAGPLYPHQIYAQWVAEARTKAGQAKERATAARSGEHDKIKLAWGAGGERACHKTRPVVNPRGARAACAFGGASSGGAAGIIGRGTSSARPTTTATAADPEALSQQTQVVEDILDATSLDSMEDQAVQELIQLNPDLHYLVSAQHGLQADVISGELGLKFERELLKKIRREEARLLGIQDDRDEKWNKLNKRKEELEREMQEALRKWKIKVQEWKRLRRQKKKEARQRRQARRRAKMLADSSLSQRASASSSLWIDNRRDLLLFEGEEGDAAAGQDRFGGFPYKTHKVHFWGDLGVKLSRSSKRNQKILNQMRALYTESYSCNSENCTNSLACCLSSASRKSKSFTSNMC